MSKKFIGFISAISAAVLWGVSGAFAQYLFKEKKLNADWLVTVRMLLTGIIMLSYLFSKEGKTTFEIWKNKKDTLQLITFSLLGMLSVQYTYFVTIQESNAATATVLQYIGPVFIAIYLAIRLKKWPKLIEVLAIILAIAGTFLLVTHGNINQLTITPIALKWGIASAIALAAYTILPVHLLNRYSSILIIGWSMLLSGLTMSLFFFPTNIPGIWDTNTICAFLFILVFGTLIPFYIFLNAIRSIGPQRTSLLACAEPLSATLIAVIYFDTTFELIDWLGTFCIIFTIILLTQIKKKQLPEL